MQDNSAQYSGGGIFLEFNAVLNVGDHLVIERNRAIGWWYASINAYVSYGGGIYVSTLSACICLICKQTSMTNFLKGTLKLTSTPFVTRSNYLFPDGARMCSEHGTCEDYVSSKIIVSKNITRGTMRWPLCSLFADTHTLIHTRTHTHTHTTHQIQGSHVVFEGNNAMFGYDTPPRPGGFGAFAGAIYIGFGSVTTAGR